MAELSGWLATLQRWRWRLAAAAALALAAGAGRDALDWPRYQRLHASGVGTNGWVTAKDLIRRRNVTYSFEVEGGVYTGVGRPGHGKPEFDELSVGDRVIVFYLPKDPKVSSLGDPKEHLRDQNRALIMPLLVLVPLAGWLLLREVSRSGEGRSAE